MKKFSLSDPNVPPMCVRTLLVEGVSGSNEKEQKRKGEKKRVILVIEQQFAL